ncbi:hypothetical protein ATANTOWER_016829 [Ataeniobius toweri]|uniref:Uncharacterized protein n=1 Tax=Ataeniobius toweri TaxID=208326 RepID=A0ABU7AYB5_9TELE|nr:hypothetical protein [Ataeniobius toweri]
MRMKMRNFFFGTWFTKLPSVRRKRSSSSKPTKRGKQLSRLASQATSRPGDDNEDKWHSPGWHSRRSNLRTSAIQLGLGGETVSQLAWECLELPQRSWRSLC